MLRLRNVLADLGPSEPLSSLKLAASFFSITDGSGNLGANISGSLLAGWTYPICALAGIITISVFLFLKCIATLMEPATTSV